jgi:hypothetical protein
MSHESLEYIFNRVGSSCVGVFWFNREYSEVKDINGLVEFTDGDLVSGVDINPSNGHPFYRQDIDSEPRGRVAVDNGQVYVFVGRECSDRAIELVKKSFGLVKYGSRVKVVRGGHWDVEGSSVFDYLDMGDVVESTVNRAMRVNDNISVKSAQAGSPKVGLFWYEVVGGNYVMVEHTEHSKGDLPMENHMSVWEASKGSLGDKYRELGWSDLPRGRVSYDMGLNKYTVVSGELCIDGVCKNKGFSSMISNTYKLPYDTVWLYSGHYDLNESMMDYNIDGSSVED